MAALGSMDAQTGGKILAKVLVFYALLNIAIECTGLAIFLAINPGKDSNVKLENLNQSQTSETLPLRCTRFVYDLAKIKLYIISWNIVSEFHGYA